MSILILETNDIKNIIAHRFPFLLVDRVIEVEPGVRGMGIKCVTANERYFEGHFPTEPIVPGVLIVESMAQTAAVVLGAAGIVVGKGEGAVYPKYFAALKEVKFRQKVIPGDQMFILVEVIKKFRAMIMVDAEVKVADKIVANGSLILSD